jgi:hypothetical protein
LHDAGEFADRIHLVSIRGDSRIHHYSICDIIGGNLFYDLFEICVNVAECCCKGKTNCRGIAFSV